MKESDNQVWESMYDEVVEKIQFPDIIIFLTSDLNRNVERINKRGREMEVN